MSCPPLRHRCWAQKPWSCWLLQLRAIAPVAILTVCLLPFLVHAFGETKPPRAQLADNQPGELARLSADVSVHATGCGNPTIKLSDDEKKRLQKVPRACRDAKFLVWFEGTNSFPYPPLFVANLWTEFAA